MRINFEVPEWATMRRIAAFHVETKDGPSVVFMAGVEMLAEWHPLRDPDYIYVKDERCCRCGGCCRGVNLTRNPVLSSIGGTCIHLVDEPGSGGKQFYCTIASERPLACMYDPLKENEPNCSITYTKELIEK